MKKLILIPFALLALTSCHHANESQRLKIDEVRFPPPAVAADREMDEKAIRIDEPVGNSDVKAVTEESNSGYSSLHSGTVKDTTKKIIKEGDISFETSNIKQTRTTIVAALKKTGGYLAEETETNDGEGSRKEYVLKTKIPAKYFDQFLSDVSATAVKIDSKNISMRDVTTQYIDMATRLQNKKLLEARYLSLLKQANKMVDILQVENKLTEIRSDIESEQGQLNYLSKQVAYSSLDITFYTKHVDPVDKPYSIGDKLIGAIVKGWDLLQDLFFGIVGLWPLITVAAILIWMLKRWRRRKKALAA